MTSIRSFVAEEKKRLSPIRWKGFVPVLVLFSALFIYFTFFFDIHLKKLLEWAGTQSNGAKVDIVRVKTSFIHTDFRLNGLQVTSHSDPMKNLIEVDNMHFQFSLPQIFKKKLVISDMSITGMQYGTARKTSGYVPKKPSKGPGFLDKVSQAANAGLKSVMDQLPLENLEGLFKGNPLDRVEKLGEDSFSFKKIREVETQVNTSVEDWKKQVVELPNENTLKDYRSRIENAVSQRPNNPDEFVRNIQTVQSIKSDVEAQVGKVEALQKSVTSNVEATVKNVASIDDAMEQDIASIRSKLKIPSLNFKDITPQLLGPKIMHTIEQAAYWAELTRKYMPKRKKGESHTTQEREKGTDVYFGGMNVYPKFLLQHAGIQSNVSTNPNHGNVRGDLTNVTNDPRLLGKPARLDIQADFPTSRIQGAKIEAVVDHTTDRNKELFGISVNSFPVEDWKIAESGPIQIALQKAQGKAGFNIQFGEEEMRATLQATLSNVQYVSGSTTPELAKILERVLKNLKSFGIRGSVEGTLSHLRFNLTSDLGSRIASGIKDEFQERIAALNEQIRKEVMGQILQKKKVLQDRVEAEKKKALEPIERSLKQVREIVGVANSARERIEREKDNFIKSQLNKGTEEIRKNIKLPGKIPGF